MSLWGVQLFKRGFDVFLQHTVQHMAIGCIATFMIIALLNATGRNVGESWYPVVAALLIGFIVELGQFSGNLKPNLLDRGADIAGYGLGGLLTAVILLLLNR